MKIYIICCFPAQSCINKNLIPEILTKMFSANQIAGFFKLTISPEQIDEQSQFLNVDTNSQKSKVN